MVDQAYKTGDASVDMKNGAKDMAHDVKNNVKDAFHEAKAGVNERRAEDAALLDPAARGDDPAPADHCAERDDEDVPCAEHLVKFGLLLFHDALPSSAVEYLARDLFDERRRTVRPEQAAVDEHIAVDCARH